MHGSQGCVSYHRSVLARHFKEPAIATTSSFSEGACVFGGGSNVKTAVKNIFDIYDPDIIACHTTCLSETIGDDLNTYIQQMDIPTGKMVIHCNTPSYVGSHINGFFNMMAGFIEYLAEKADICNGKIGIFPGFVNPGDMREMKRIAELVKADYIMFPDISGVMDAPITGRYSMLKIVVRQKHILVITVVLVSLGEFIYQLLQNAIFNVIIACVNMIAQMKADPVSLQKYCCRKKL